MHCELNILSFMASVETMAGLLIAIRVKNQFEIWSGWCRDYWSMQHFTKFVVKFIIKPKMSLRVLDYGI